jgi:hypothetical protein
MQSFNFLFCLILSEMILHHTDKLSQALQQPRLSSVEGHEIAMLTVKTLEVLRNDESFDLFWEVKKTRDSVNVDEPWLARRQKVPKEHEQGKAPAEFAATPRDEFRRLYYEALDLATASIQTRFDQEGFKGFQMWNSY